MRIARYALALAALLPVPVTAAPEAQQPGIAPSNCAPAQAALTELRQRFDERPFWIGNLADGSSVVITRASNGKSWTLLAVGGGRDAMACMIAEGKAPIAGAATE